MYIYFTTFIVHCFINYIYYFPVSYCIIFIFIVVVTCFLLYLHALICYAPVISYPVYIFYCTSLCLLRIYYKRILFSFTLITMYIHLQT